MSSTSGSKSHSAVVDNNILVDLYELERLDLLFDVFDNVLIPRVIYEDEVLVDVHKELEKYPFLISDLEDEAGYGIYLSLTTDKKFRNLSTYDKMAISIAGQYSYYCNSNDGLVRKTCRALDVKCLGILGVIEKAYIFKLITSEQLLEMCERLVSDETTCYISKQVVAAFLVKI